MRSFSQKKKMWRTHGRTRHDSRSTAEKEQNRHGLYKYIWRYAPNRYFILIIHPCKSDE